jgi:hypothetical protein
MWWEWLHHTWKGHTPEIVSFVMTHKAIPQYELRSLDHMLHLVRSVLCIQQRVGMYMCSVPLNMLTVYLFSVGVIVYMCKVKQTHYYEKCISLSKAHWQYDISHMWLKYDYSCSHSDNNRQRDRRKNMLHAKRNRYSSALYDIWDSLSALLLNHVMLYGYNAVYCETYLTRCYNKQPVVL